MPHCKAEVLLDFLDSTESEFLYLVGDIIDVKHVQNDWYWSRSHNAVMSKLLSKAKSGTCVVYIPGNHDEILRQLAGSFLGAIFVANQVIHETADGRRLLVLHGDEFESLVRQNAILTFLGENGYNLVQLLNRGFNHLRGQLGYPYWSLCAYVKKRLKKAVTYVERFELAAARKTTQYSADGLVCGHIHVPNLKYLNGVLYCNTGDWVDSCAALTEHYDGTLQLLKWLEVRTATTPLHWLEKAA